jgi:hypothetical protein
MKRILLALATAVCAFSAQAQNIMLCDPVMIAQKGTGPRPIEGGKKLPISVSAFSLVTPSERFNGDGQEHMNSHGTYYMYRDPKTGDQAHLLFTKDNRAMLTVAMNKASTVLMLQCYPQ